MLKDVERIFLWVNIAMNLRDVHYMIKTLIYGQKLRIVRYMKSFITQVYIEYIKFRCRHNVNAIVIKNKLNNSSLNSG